MGLYPWVRQTPEIALKVATECVPAGRSWMVSRVGEFGRLVMLERKMCLFRPPLFLLRPTVPELRRTGRAILVFGPPRAKALGYSVRPFHRQTRNSTSEGTAKPPTANCQPLTLYRSGSEAGNDLFLGEQVESDGWDHRKGNERQHFSPVRAVLTLVLHNS